MCEAAKGVSPPTPSPFLYDMFSLSSGELHGNGPKGMIYLVSWFRGIIYAYVEGREMDFCEHIHGGMIEVEDAAGMSSRQLSLPRHSRKKTS